jgi:phosphomannomutase/phosphoglucomutase
MNIPAHIFREYDIRGFVEKELNEEFAYLLGRGYATKAKEAGKNTIGIGWDCRLTSEPYARALARGINDEGLDVELTGMGPTPQVYYAIFSRNLGGGIQVTGSHNPSDMNGFKILIGKETLSGAEIQDIKARVFAVAAKGVDAGHASKKGTTTERPVQREYIKELIERSKNHVGNRKLKVVVDAGNGVGGLVGPEVLRAVGVEVIELFCDPDGRFPNHHPDPTEVKNLKSLIAKVKETKADFGIGWDGDADRIGVVDENGAPIFGDMLLLLYAREILKEVKSPTVIGDVKCSSLLFNDLRARGANAIMWKTGHSLIKAKLKETHGELAGEMSGHIFFKHRYFGFDDALYASLRFVEIVSHAAGPVSQLLSDLPTMVSTPEIRADCPEEIKFKILDVAKERFKEYDVDPLDGVRITFPQGWGLVRASNTQPVLVMRFEATSTSELERIQTLVTEKIEEIKRELR